METSVVSLPFPDPAADGRVSNGDRSAVRYAGTCHENLSRRPLGRTRAVARWDGNVALQRWGCGRCRPRDGGRGYRFTARRSPILRISRLLLAESLRSRTRPYVPLRARFFRDSPPVADYKFFPSRALRYFRRRPTVVGIYLRVGKIFAARLPGGG